MVSTARVFCCVAFLFSKGPPASTLVRLAGLVFLFEGEEGGRRELIGSDGPRFVSCVLGAYCGGSVFFQGVVYVANGVRVIMAVKKNRLAVCGLPAKGRGRVSEDEDI